MVSTDFLLGKDGDLKLSENMDAIPTDSLCQIINIALRWFLGEWKFDNTKGVGWFDTVFIKNPDEEEIESMITAVLMDFPEVENVVTVLTVVDKLQRKAVISWKAKTSQGVIESEVNMWSTE
ncbi:MAG: hypothetical protein ACRDBO_00265 [Lachnospiraceae bacterium]